MKLRRVRLHKKHLIPGVGTVDEIESGGETLGAWVVVAGKNGPVAIWGGDVAPSEVDDTVSASEATPARGRARPPAPEGQ